MLKSRVRELAREEERRKGNLTKNFIVCRSWPPEVGAEVIYTENTEGFKEFKFVKAVDPF